MGGLLLLGHRSPGVVGAEERNSNLVGQPQRERSTTDAQSFRSLLVGSAFILL